MNHLASGVWSGGLGRNDDTRIHPFDAALVPRGTKIIGEPETATRTHGLERLLELPVTG
jgi:hypothetical protein